VQLLERGGLLALEAVMHNMTRVSGKGIVQLEERADDLPHWVLSAMKCLANWPRQLRTQNGRESCLPSYPGFEQDVFNVVKDYFLGLSEPLTTFGLFDFFLDAWVKAEAVSVARSLPPEPAPRPPGCRQHPGSAGRPCSRPYTVTAPDLGPSGPSQQFYTMSEAASSEDLLQLAHQERVARIRQTFTVMPPLATSSNKGSVTNSSNMTSNSSNSTFLSSASLSPDMSTTAIMRSFLPPNTCFETVFMESSPVTRIVPQAQSEVLHLGRSASGRSLTSIPSASSWPTRSSATQTETARPEGGSLKRLPRWKRSSRLRKSVAVMERSPERPGGRDNGGFAGSPGEEAEPGGALRHTPSLDNLLERGRDREQFLLKYRQVSGDLRAGPDLVAEARAGGRARPGRKDRRRTRGASSAPSLALRGMRLEEATPHAYDNPGMEVSPRAPLARQECDLSPVGGMQAFPRQHQYNSSYRLATLQPSSPRLPRTSTRLSLARPAAPPRPLEPVYTVAGPGPLRRYPAPARRPDLSRGAPGRASSLSHQSQATVDSGRFSLPPGPPAAALPVLQLLGLLLPPASRRKLQLLLKFILKISMNSELTLDPCQSNASLCLDTFLSVVLRPRGAASPRRDLARPVLQVGHTGNSS
jgi:hypothetical protein